MGPGSAKTFLFFSQEITALASAPGPYPLPKNVVHLQIIQIITQHKKEAATRMVIQETKKNGSTEA